MWKIPTSSSIPKFHAIVIYVTGFVLLLKLLENYLNIFCKFKGAWKLLKNEKFKKTRKKNIESYLVQERLGKKIFKTKLVSSTLRTVAVKLVYSPTRFV